MPRKKVDDRKIARAYQRGKSGPTLAREHGIEVSTVYAALERAGVPRRQRNLNLDPKPIVGAYRAGASTLDLASLYNVSVGTIQNVLRRAGMELRASDAKPPNLTDRRVATLRNVGFTDEQIEQMQARRDPTRSRIISPDDANDIIAAYQAGESLRSLADQYGTSYETIRRTLLRNGAELRGPGRAPERQPQ